MKTSFQQETRDRTIERHVTAYLRETGVSEQSYVARVVELYQSRTPQAFRSHAFHVGGDAYRDVEANTQLVHRMLHGSVRLSAEIEESLILALPPDRERKLWIDLAARVGRLSIAEPAAGPTDLYTDCAQLLGDAGEVLKQYRGLLADGRISTDDTPDSLKLALERLRQLAATVHTLQREITDTLAEQGNAHLIAPGIREVA